MKRIDYPSLAPEAGQALYALEQYVRSSGLDRKLLELVKTRASQINGCAYCLDMHAKDARAAGETEQRLYTLSAWREAPFYSERERAALAWTEALTNLPVAGAPEELFEATRAHFSDKELVDLTMAICAINTWNRVSVGLGADVGSYEVETAG